MEWLKDLVTNPNIAWLVTALVALSKWAKAHWKEVLLHAGEAVAYVEKWKDPSWTNQQLEDEAVRYFRTIWPDVPEWLMRAGIREICRRRKQQGALYAGPGATAPIGESDE